MIIGIYMIKNMHNNKVYIGQSANINKRWNNHRSKLENNSHENKHLQDSYNKYGKDNFEYTIICECRKEELNDLEKYYIRKYHSYDNKYGYNLTKGGDQYEFNDDTIEKMRESHKHEYVPIVQFTKDKKLVNKFKSLSEASRSVNGTPSGIRNCANSFSYGSGKNKTYKGYLWIYEDDIGKFNKLNIEEYLKTKTSFPVNKYEYPSGKYICTYDTVLEAAIKNNISVDVISMCVRGVQIKSGNFTYRNANKIDKNKDIEIIITKKKIVNNRSVIGFDIKTGNPLIYSSSIIGLKKQGFHTGHVWQCCNGKKKTYKGYIWKYADEQFEKYFADGGIKKVEQKSLADL